MLRIPRKFMFDPTEVGVYHCINQVRCRLSNLPEDARHRAQPRDLRSAATIERLIVRSQANATETHRRE